MKNLINFQGKTEKQQSDSMKGVVFGVVGFILILIISLI